MIDIEQIILIGILGVVALLSFLFLVLYYSKPKKLAKSQKKVIMTKEEELEHILSRYGKMKDYYLTYLQCCYGAFITIFIGIVAIPVLPISNPALKSATVIGFWFVGGYYLAQIIYTYGQLRVVYGLMDVDDVISREVEKLGFPFNILERIFKYTRKPIYGRANAKYIVIVLGYFVLLVISIISCLSA